MIVLGVVILSINRNRHGTRWRYSALLLPIGIAAIRGFVHPITKLGLTIWPASKNGARTVRPLASREAGCVAAA
jgi:hypothetical protein